MNRPGDWALSCLGHQFSHPELLEQALTHRSADSRHNERLEFLGDAVLGLVITNQLYVARPDADEGALSRIRASLVNRSTLADLATQIHLGDLIRLGSGELKSGGHLRQSILSDALEAVLGAVFIDGGYSEAEAVILHLYAARLRDLPNEDDLKDSKTRLQETLQGDGLPPPHYQVRNVSGPAHSQQFEVACRVESMDIETSGTGKSRRAAEQQAAARVLELLTDGAGNIS